MTARRLDRRLLLTILLVIEVVRAAPASNAASAATSEPAPATTTDTALVDDSLPGFNNGKSSRREPVSRRDPWRSDDDPAVVADRVRRRGEDVPSLEAITKSKRKERTSRVGARDGRAGAELAAVAPYGPFALPYYGALVAVAAPPYQVSPLGYAGATGTFDAGSSGPMFRQAPSFPFQVQWPLASYFPVLIKDPFLTFLHGGSWNDLVEYGQAADVCTHRRFRESPWSRPESLSDEEEPSRSSRRGRSLVKRAVSQTAPLLNSLAAVVQRAKKINKTKHKKTKPALAEEHNPNEKNSATENSENGDLRFPFGGFDWFGNKKPVAPSPGFFINRLKVRRGGVAIAGPGGVATAGRGGTAVVGPGGLAYTQPGGLAVAGPHARVLALTADADLDALAERIRTRLASGSPVTPDPQAALVATGPVVYYHNENPSSA